MTEAEFRFHHCGRKSAYPDIITARRYVAKAGQKTGHLNVYKCDFHRHFHIGHRGTPPSLAR